MEEIAIKTHLIITDIHEEYEVNWCGKILDAKPMLKNSLPIFTIVGSKGRVELNTVDMKRIEKTAKLLTQPRGRSAITTDVAHIYIKEVDENEKLIGTVTHHHVKSFAPMYDKVGYK